MDNVRLSLTSVKGEGIAPESASRRNRTDVDDPVYSDRRIPDHPDSTDVMPLVHTNN